jgi:hypothetical protein
MVQKGVEHHKIVPTTVIHNAHTVEFSVTGYMAA